MVNYDGNFSGRDVTLRLEVTQAATQDIPGNKSYVDWTLRAFRNSAVTAWSDNPSAWHVNINGQEWWGNWTYNFGSNTNQVIAQGSSSWISHEADGTKTINVSSDAQGAGLLGNAGNSGQFTFTAIPRSSGMTFTNPLVAGQSTTFTINRASTSMTHDMYYWFGSKQSQGIIGGVATSFTWTPPLSLLNEIPNAASGTGFIRVHTFHNGALIGFADYPFTLNAPATAAPTFNAVAPTEATAGVAANVGAYVQNVSTLNVAVGSPAAQYGATISAYKIEVAGQTINAASGVTTPIAASGTVPIVATVTDSRGLSTTKTTNITVLAYTPPVISSLGATRSTGATNAPDTGTDVKTTFTANVQSLVNGTQRNQLVYRIYSRLRGATTWTLKSTSALAAGTITFTGSPVVGTYPLTEAHEFRVDVSDDFNTASQQFTIPTAGVFMHWGGQGQGVGVGKYWERGGLDVRGQIHQNDGQTVASWLTGEIKLWPSATIPTGFLLCNGQAVSRTTYATLYAALGGASSPWGQGDGSTTFNVPDYRGRVPVRFDSAQTEFDTMGEAGGSKTHTLTVNEMPAHGHSSNRSIGFNQGNGAYHASEWTSATGRTDPWTTDNTGGGAAHNNLQPYRTVNFIIKT